MLTVIAGPTEEPISLPEAKAHLRVDFSDDDAYISALVMVARDYTEGFQGRSLAPVTLELSLDSFPCGPIRLPRTPVTSVVSVKYTRSDGAVVTMPNADYIVKKNGDTIPSYGKYWPADILIPGDALNVRYLAGYDSTTIPPATKQAMLLLIGHWYENRETVIIGKTPAEVPLAATSLLWMDRTW